MNKKENKNNLIKDPEKRLAKLQKAFVEENISKFCLENEMSRSTFYRWKKRFEQAGLSGLSPIPTIPHSKIGVTPIDVQKKIVKQSLLYPEFGRNRLCSHLKKMGIEINSSLLQKILTKNGLGTRALRDSNYLSNLQNPQISHRMFTSCVTDKKYKAVAPGEIIAIDLVKIEGRFFFVAVDIYSTFAFLYPAHEINPLDAIGIMKFAKNFFETKSYAVKKVITNKSDVFLIIRMFRL